MAVTFGFYNSLNGDRKYDAVALSSIFDGIVRDGIMASIGTSFIVKSAAVENMSVIIGTGRAWFDHTWTLNNSELPITVPISEVLQDRIDTVVLRIDATESARANYIWLVKGTPSTNPVRPILTRTSLVKEYPLCDIKVNRGVTSITQSDITNRIGSSDTPFSTGILESITTDGLTLQWQHQFDTWIKSLQDVLSDDAAANLAAEILVLQGRITELENTPIPTIPEVPPNMHRVTFRGKYLGASFSDAQKAAVRNGSFADLFVGDYWTMSGHNWRIVDINYWLKTGDMTPFTTNHLVIMPDTPLMTSIMHTQNSTSGGYANSQAFNVFMEQLLSNYVRYAFPTGYLSRRTILSTAAANGLVTATSWISSVVVDLPNELNMYGSYISTIFSSVTGPTPTIDKTQFALFQICPEFIISTSDCWLRDIVDSMSYAVIKKDGTAGYYGAFNGSAGFRPCFAIG